MHPSRLWPGGAVATSVSEWKRFHSPVRQAQGPESLDRLGTLSLSKRPVEGLTLVATTERSTMGLGTWASLSAPSGRPADHGGRIERFCKRTGETPVPPWAAVPGGMGVSPMFEHCDAQRRGGSGYAAWRWPRLCPDARNRRRRPRRRRGRSMHFVVSSYPWTPPINCSWYSMKRSPATCRR